MATVLPLLLVPGTCLECRAAPHPLSVACGLKSVSYEAHRRAAARARTHSPYCSSPTRFLLTANRDDPFARRDPGGRDLRGQY